MRYNVRVSSFVDRFVYSVADPGVRHDKGARNMKYQQPLSIAIFSSLFGEGASPCGDTAIKQEFLSFMVAAAMVKRGIWRLIFPDKENITTLPKNTNKTFTSKLGKNHWIFFLCQSAAALFLTALGSHFIEYFCK